MASTVRRAGFVSRLVALSFAIALIAASCGDSTETTTSPLPPQPPVTTEPAATGTTSTTQPATTTTITRITTNEAPTTTTTEPEPEFTIASHGAGAVNALPESDGKSGSGCAPGPGALPDGIWFGLIREVHARSVLFDLACLVPGPPPTATNTNPRLRDVPAAPGLEIHTIDGSTTPYMQWKPSGRPLWIYVNGGIATQAAVCTLDVSLEPEPATAWSSSEVRLPVGGGCCATNHNGPASPDEPWPTSGLPADGVYFTDVVIDSAADELALTIMRFVACDESPSRCIPDIAPGDVWIDHGNAIARRARLDDRLTVRIAGIQPSADATHAAGIVGTGTLFASLLEQRATAWEDHIGAALQAGTPSAEIREELLRRGQEDPGFPYGPSDCCGPTGFLVFRGPLGVELVEWMHETSGQGFIGATQLEVIDGLPVLTIDAGQIAG